MTNDTAMEAWGPEWIPHKPGDLDTESAARAIVEISRDAAIEAAELKEGRLVSVKFNRFDCAMKVVKCLNERYGGCYGSIIEVEIVH